MRWHEKDGKVVARKERGYKAEIAPSVTSPGKFVVWVYRFYCKTAAVGFGKAVLGSVDECKVYAERAIAEDNAA